VPRIGSIRTATEQALTDAKAVADIREQVENQRATVDLVATESAKAKELSERAEKQVNESAVQLADLKGSVSQAQSLLDVQRREAEFTSLITRAQNDDRASFDALRGIAQDPSNRFSAMAANAYNTIYKAHSAPIYYSDMRFPWAAGVDPKALTLQQIETDYPTITTYLKPAFLEYIWGRDDIGRVARLDFLINVIKTDPSLTAVEYAGRYFDQGTSQQIDPVAVDYILNWWKQHRKEFEDTGQPSEATPAKAPP
jgi:hypothetical protein